MPNPSLPSRRPPPPSRPHPSIQAAQNVAQRGPVGRKIRPLVYAVGIAAIAASGAWIGAILKGDLEQKGESKKAQSGKGSSSQSQTSPSQTPQPGAAAGYEKAIQSLESRRAYLLGQKVSLEKKISDFHESQAQKEIEEREKREFGLKR